MPTLLFTEWYETHQDDKTTEMYRDVAVTGDYIVKQWGKNAIVVFVPSCTVSAKDNGYGYTAMTTLSYIGKNVGFSEYADALTQSTNGVVDVRSVQAKNMAKSHAKPRVA